MKIEKIINNHLCLGCGLCASLYPTKCKMSMDNQGFYYPNLSNKLTKDEDNYLGKLCPSIHVKGNGKIGFWGKVDRICEGWATDDQIRYRASSGGATTALAKYLLESRQVDAVLHVGVKENDCLTNELKISRTAEEIIQNSQSRYAPVIMFEKIIQILDSTEETYCFVGKPCDIAVIRNLQAQYPQYKHRIKYCISIFCAGMPSLNATKSLLKKSGKNSDPERMQYRGNGWPGYFQAWWKDGSTLKLTYNESWGNFLGRSLGVRCKVCPDGIGMLADIAVGDSWSTKSGFPDFSEQPGRCFIMIRSQLGEELINEATLNGYIQLNSLNIHTLPTIQPYQYQRRKLILWRFLPLYFKTNGLIKFHNLGILRNGLKVNPVLAFRTLVGSIRRIH